LRQYKIIIAFVLVILLTFSSIVISGKWKDKTSVKKIELSGNTTLSKEEIFDYAKLTDSLISSNALTLDMIESRIAKHPNIKKVNVTRESADIKIEISEKNPFAVDSTGKELFLVDDQLSLYTFKKENVNIDLPVISGLSQQLDLEEYGKDDMLKLKVAHYIISKSIRLNRSLYHFISEISFSDSTGIILYSFDDATPIYFLDYSSIVPKDKFSEAISVKDITNPSLRSAIDEKLVYLNNFLKQIRVYKTKNSFSYVDLRYKDMIVVKNNKLLASE
jgi:cell division septal protein FtsQ